MQPTDASSQRITSIRQLTPLRQRSTGSTTLEVASSDLLRAWNQRGVENRALELLHRGLSFSITILDLTPDARRDPYLQRTSDPTA